MPPLRLRSISKMAYHLRVNRFQYEDAIKKEGHRGGSHSSVASVKHPVRKLMRLRAPTSLFHLATAIDNASNHREGILYI